MVRIDEPREPSSGHPPLWQPAPTANPISNSAIAPHTTVSQRGETTMEALATVALPSRRHGLPDYPDPPAGIAAKAKAFLARHHELGGK